LTISKKYTMRISRLTVDKLGIQMYDRVSAVLAELIANAYDADAEHVKIMLPFGEYLARQISGEIVDQGFEILIEDDGSGMTESEILDYYLNVGYNRRAKRGDRSPKHQRRIMGRKGIGKLAPFGICREVEVLTAGGTKTQHGYPVSNLILDLDDILEEKINEKGEIEPYHPQPGDLDETYSPSVGTKLILRRFDRRRVPTAEELDRQLAARFGLQQNDWRVQLTDSKATHQTIELGTLNVDIMEGTCINVSGIPVEVEGQFHPVSGWVGYAKDPYKDEVMAGVRIYARGKIVAQTRDFDIRTGFTGEFKMRSYLTGAIHAEWLDEDEDFVRTDRQDIIWNSEYGDAFREWGRNLLKELASKAETSSRTRLWEVFSEASGLQERLQYAHPDDRTVRDSVLRAARTLIARSDRDSLADPEYVERVVRLAYAIGPHNALLETLDEVASTANETIDAVLGLFEKARLVEMYSLGQVAQERMDAVQQLDRFIGDPDTSERQLQELLEKTPWIIYPDWTPLSYNQRLASTRRNFENWYLVNRGHSIITSTINNSTKQPDFVMLSHLGSIEIIEIKKPQHALIDDEFNRAFGYLDAMSEFIDTNPEVKSEFPRANLTIVCDHLNLSTVYTSALENDLRIEHRPWHALLHTTNRSHEDFLRVVGELQGELPRTTSDDVLTTQR